MNSLFERFEYFFNHKKSIDDKEAVKNIIGTLQMNDLDAINKMLDDHFSN